MSQNKTISEQKVWMKHYPADSAKAELPKMSAYAYYKARNVQRMNETTIYYYGKKISVKKFISLIDKCADAFAALGVK